MNVSAIGRGPDERAMASRAAGALVLELFDIEREHAALVERVRKAEKQRAELAEQWRLRVSWDDDIPRELGAVLSIVRGEPFWARGPMA